MKRSQTTRAASVKRWFSLIEAMLSLSAATLVTAVVVPAASSMLSSAKETRVQMELNAIAAGLAEFSRDVGFYPGMVPGETDNASIVLATDAAFPADDDGFWGSAQQLSLHQYLCINGTGTDRPWSGPYLSTLITEDPWGSAYLINISCSRDGQAVYVVSAGKNGTVDTTFAQDVGAAAVGGDDYAVRLQ